MGCTTHSRHSQAWEYKTVVGVVSGEGVQLDAAINGETNRGWQLVTVGSYGERSGFAVMRREKK